ncbi:helix-turn-helix domain-containing protein [Nonomuraea polychroma]|uniref:helix-turn-helix domain-containing protein n=1 Tax=Nonomuraea polychroma TaxID=46176 RepID=UPI000FDDA6AF|nr:hypothetical protein [Nonomuraea polychroma]
MEVDVWTGHTAKALRNTLHMTQEAFADHLQVAVRTVREWEKAARLDKPLSRHAHVVLGEALRKASASAMRRFVILAEQKATHVNRAAIYDDPREVLMAAAHESAEDAASKGVSCGSESIADLHDRTVVVARAYSSRPVRGHVKVPAGGQFEVTTGGRFRSPLLLRAVRVSRGGVCPER